MECGILGCPGNWTAWLPRDAVQIEYAHGSTAFWDLLVLTPDALEGPCFFRGRCRLLAAPGDAAPEQLRRFGPKTVVTYGLSHRDSLTLSSLAEPVLCVQRRLPRPDGIVIEPQEFPLSNLPGPAPELLPLLALRLLHMPLTEALSF